MGNTKSTNNKVENNTNNSVIYLRVSSKLQKSLDEQQEVCSSFANKNKLNVCGIFADSLSGKNISLLSNFKIMYDLLYTNKVDHLIVHEISRLGRDIKLLQELKKLINCNITIHSVSENIHINKYSKENDKDLFFEKVVQSINYSRDLSTRLKNNYKIRKNTLQFMGRKCPYGFNIVKIGYKRYLEKNNDFINAQKLYKKIKSNKKYKCEIELTYYMKRNFVKNFLQYIKISKEYEKQQIKLQNPIIELEKLELTDKENSYNKVNKFVKKYPLKFNFKSYN